MVFKQIIANTPRLFITTIQIPANTKKIISFPDEFFGRATSLLIRNNDGANSITYRYGGESQPLINLAASSFDTVDAAKVNLLEVNTGAVGTTTIICQTIPIQYDEIIIPESV